MANLLPFDGELDGPAAGLKPFTGKLDNEQAGMADVAASGISKAGEGLSGMANRFGYGSGLTFQEIGRVLQAPAATSLEMVTGLGAAISDEDYKPGRQELARQASDYAAAAREENRANGNAFADLGWRMEQLGKEASTHYDKTLPETSPEMVRQMGELDKAEGFTGNVKAMVMNPLGTAGQVMVSVPDMAVGAGIGSLAGKAGMALSGAAAEAAAKTAGRTAAAEAIAGGATVPEAVAAGKGAAETAYRATLQDTAERVAGSTGLVTEAGQSGMQNRLQTEQTIMDKARIPDATLYERSAKFRELVDGGMAPDEARASIARELGNEAGALGSLFTGAGSKVAGGAEAMGKTVAGAALTGKQTLKNIAKEGFEEALQNPGENWAQYVAQAGVDPNAKYDFGGSVAQGLVMGAAMGAPMHGAGYIGTKFRGGDQAPAQVPAQVPDNGPLSRAANIALANGAADAAAQAKTAQSGYDATGTGDEKSNTTNPPDLAAPDRVTEIDAQVRGLANRMAELDNPENGYGPAFDLERQDLLARHDQLSQERADLTADWPAAVAGSPTTFSTESGERIEATYALMNAADLNTSHDEALRPSPRYPKQLQPRERDRAASEMQISGIAQRLDPARLGESADAATGAPIVGADGLVESGNARTIALKRVYQTNPEQAAAYKAFLRDNASRFGLTPEAVAAMPTPVLVRVRQTPVDRAEFARQANASTVAQMSSSEQARSDAARLDNMDDLRPDDNGDFTTSRDFIRRFVGRLPTTEQAGMIDAGGRLSQTGYTRIRNAVLAKAYGDSPVLARLVESLDDNLRNIGKALMQAAPEIAKLRQDVNEGALFDADITPDLLAAVEELASLRDSGKSVHDALAQAGMFGDSMSPEVRELLAFLDENIRRPRKIAEFIQRYAEALRAAGNPNQGSLLGETQAPAKGDIINAAWEKDNEATGQGTGQAAGNQGTGQETSQGRAGAENDNGRSQGDASATTQEWVAFPPETGTLGIPRAEMPQIQGAHRGALVNFLEARGIGNRTVETPADRLRPTQAEFSTKKAEKWKEVKEGSDRSVLTSSDGYILDGHHQWVAALASNGDVKEIRFDAPINTLIAEVFQFPSVKRGEGAVSDAGRAQARQDFQAAMADLGAIVRDYANVARMVPESTPDLLPTLVKLFSAGIKEIGYNMKDLIAYVKKAMRADAGLKTVWNKVDDKTYQKAARQAIDATLAQPRSVNQQGDLFAQPNLEQPAVGQTGDLFGAMAHAAPSVFHQMEAEPAPAESVQESKGADHGQGQEGRRQEVLTATGGGEVAASGTDFIEDNGKRYHLDANNFGVELPRTLPDGHPLLTETLFKDSVLWEGKEHPREVMRQALVDKAFAGIQPATGKPIAYVMGGGGASGKGSVKTMLVKQGIIDEASAVSLDPDEIKGEIPEYNAIIDAKDSRAAAVAHEESSDIAKRIKKRAIDGGYNLVLDVTLGDQAKGEQYLRELKDSGYEVKLFGVTVQPELAVVRAIERAKKTDRWVPINMLLKAHKGFNGAFESYAKIADSALLFDNTTERQELAKAEAGNLVVLNHEAYNGIAERSQINEGANTLRQISSRLEREGPGVPSRVQQAQPGGRGRELERHQRRDGRGRSGAEESDSGVDGIGSKRREGLVNESRDNRPGSPQGEESGTVQQPQAEGEAGELREGKGGRDQRGDRQPDDGNRQEAWPERDDGTAGQGGATQGGGKPRSGRSIRGTAGVPVARDIPAKSGRNYAFGASDLTYEGSWLAKARQNVEALELLKQLETDGRQATPQEQAVLAKFIGWGSSDIANSIFGGKLDKQLPVIAQYEEAIADFDRVGRDYLRKGGGYRGDYADRGYYAAVAVLRAAGKIEGNYQYPERVSRADLEAAKPDMGAKKWAELRDRVKAALSPAEWREASRSTQYAHYTSKAVVQSMMQALQRMGFKGGTILEPGAGIGVFPGLMPAEMANNSVYTGVEFDSVTGGILKQLFPDERILVESFIDTALPDNYYDIGFGNPPFGSIPILADPKYRKQGFSLHDYFFAKTLDSVKPGGLVVFVTSRYTMDKLDDKARSYLADRADLVGAIRLPQTAFKKNAGTDVVTDVLFLRKKIAGETFDQAQPWAKSVPMQVGSKSFPINEYFHVHPEMVLGKHSDAGKMANTDEAQYTVEANPGDIEAQFSKAADALPENVFAADRGSAAEAAQVRELDFNPKAKKEGNYYIADDGKLMVRERGYGVPAEVGSDGPLVRSLVGLRDALKQAHYDQLNDGPWETSLSALQKSYRDFVAKHGRIHQFSVYQQRLKVDKLNEDGEPTGDKEWGTEQRRRFPVLNAFRDDPDWTLIAALEDFNDETGEISEGKFLSERVLGKPQPVQATTPTDALLQTLNDVGKIDMAMIADRLGISEREAIEALGPLIYEHPGEGWQTADEYLSGDVRKKLKQAEAAAKTDRRFQRNVEALIAVLPAPRTHTEITPQIGMPWIPAPMYAQFLREKADIDVTVTFNERTGQWHVAIDDTSYTKTDRRSKRKGDLSLAATQDWGTDRRNAAEVLEYALTGAPIRIMSKQDLGGGKSKEVFDAVATEAVASKVNQMREAFKGWLWQDAGRIEQLVPLYNDRFNTMVPRKFDGSHMTLAGASVHWQQKAFPHVKRGAWRIIQTGNVYLAHAVGSGKTAQMVIAAMEEKRLGLVKKPMFVVPNHMLAQFASEWLDIYPAARLMVADEQNFTGDNRRRFVSRVALSDLDGVIITQSAFKLLDLDPEFKGKMIEQELDYLRSALLEAGGKLDEKGKSRDPKVKQIETRIERMEQKLQAAMAGEGKDNNVRFDEMGVDKLYVDEAHLYRKLSFVTQRQVKGIDPNGSDQAFDLFMKVQWLRENKNSKRNLVMASGTPVTNTMAELYTVQRYMAPEVLEERGLAEFDQWASMFGAESTAIEPDAAGKYGPVTRFNKFVNVGELTQMFRDFADVLTSDYLASILGDKRPKVKGGSRSIAITPKTDAYEAFQKQDLQPRMEASRAWKPSRDEPNNPDPIIKIIGDGRLAAIDMRFMNPSQASDPNSKLNRMIDEIIRVHQEVSAWEYTDKKGKTETHKGAAQIVFSDLGFGAGVAANRGFNARAWMEKRLREAGIPAAQVAFMADYKKSAEKLKLFSDVNSGKVRVVVGSSKNMGTGVNAQQRLIALHHLDAPWYPADLEQREGRIVRQGNKNPEVQLYAYAAKGSYDEQMWSTLARKQFFIDQALSGDPNIREIEDLGESSQFEIAAAMVADDPRVLQLAGLRAEIERLGRLYVAHEEQIGGLRRNYQAAKSRLDWANRQLVDAEKEAAKVKDLSGDNFIAEAGGKSFASRKEWGAALLAKFKELSDRVSGKEEVIGKISGFDVIFFDIGKGTKQYLPEIGLRTTEDVSLAKDPSADPVGVALRAVNGTVAVSRLPVTLRQTVEDARAQMNALEPRLNAPFPLYPMLLDKEAEARALEDEIVRAGQNDGLAREQALEDAWAERTGAITPLFSRGVGDGMALRDLTAVVDRVSKGLKNLPRVHVMESPAALSTKDLSQKALRDFIRKAGAWEDVEGATHDGEIYLFASGLADEARAEHVLATHEVTHYGLRGAIGRDLDAALQHVWMTNAKVRQAAQQLKSHNRLGSNVEAVEEVLADLRAEDLPKLVGWRRVVKAMRDWLNRIGATALAKRLDREIRSGIDAQQQADLFVADLVTAAREWVRSGKSGGAAMVDTRLSDQSLAEDVAAQEKWLTKEAQARGYKSIDDLAEKNYKAFENLAKLWRDRHPVDGVMLSRVVAEWNSKDNPPEPGKPFMVYRLALQNEPGLANRNAADAEGLAAFLMSTEDFDSSIKSAGDTIYAYEVKADQFGDYAPFNKGRAVNSSATVGMMAKWGGHWLSFPAGAKYQERLVGSFSLAQARTKLKEMHGDGYFDNVGALKGAKTIREIMLQDFDGANLPRLSRGATTQPVQATAAQRADEIIMKPAASWRPIDAILRTVSHTVRLDRLTTAIYDKAGQLIDRYTPDQVKAGVISDYGIPEAVIDHRVMMQGRMRVQMRKAGELIDKLATLTRAESRVAYEWMNNANPQAAAYFEAQLPEESVKVMEEVKGLIDKLSQEAVALGQLDPEAFQRNRFEYLRRSYIKHTAELTKGETAARKRAIAILGDQYKGRGMDDPVDMAKVKNVAPEWWGRKLQQGKADKDLKGEKFIRLERRAAIGEGVADLEPAQGPGETNRQRKGRLLEVAYWPANEPLPARYKTWDQNGTWEVRDTKGAKLVMWRDFSKQERIQLGEIDEARYAIAKTLHGMIHDVETGRYLEWLASSLAKKAGEALDGEIIDASERMRDTFPPGTWVQVPDTKIAGTNVKKYGLLAGRYLPGPVWNDVRQTVGFRFKPLGETYAAILSAWKTSKTALSPAVHTNNVMANFVMADWHDVTAGHILKALRILLGASQRQGKGIIGRTGNMVSRAGLADAEAAREIVNRYLDSGANLGSWVTGELQRDQLEPLLAALEKEIGTIGETASGQVGAMVALQKALQLRFPSAWEAFKPTRAGQAMTTEVGSIIDLYEAEDQVFRLAAWLKAKEDGAGDLAAGKVARRSFLDYHINAPWIQAMRSTAFPFIGFTYRSVPMLLEVAAKKPHKLLKLALMAGALNALGYLASGGDEDDERKLLPEEKAGKIWGMVPKLIRMPWNDKFGAPVFLDVRRFVPVGDVFDTGQTHAAIPMLPFAVPGGPLAVMAELATNKSQFTGKEITRETDTALEKATKVGDHLYKAFAPNLIFLPGTYAWTATANASSGKTDSFGRELSTGQAVASSFGVKLGAYPADVLQLNATREAKAKKMEIDRTITQLKREHQRNGIDDQEFKKSVDAQLVKKMGIAEDLQRKMTGK